MKILIHSNGPMVPTGYGQQTALLLPRLREMGHQVAVSAFYGVSGSPIRWNGYTVYPAGASDFGTDVMLAHAGHMGADLLLTLMDVFKLAPAASAMGAAVDQGLKIACWLPTDCTPLSRVDLAVLRASRAVPIAMSQFGLANLQDAAAEPGSTWSPDQLYRAPHAVDTTVYAPPPDRHLLRQALGVDEHFVIGLCAANRDVLRKAFPEQFRAFAIFRRKHPEALLLVHSVTNGPAGFDLRQMAADMGIADAVMFSDQYSQVGGHTSPQEMAAWYGCLDWLTACSYAEAFGVPIVEAQACGTPVIVTSGSAMHELMGSGFRVKGSEFWNPVHRAWWVRPDVPEIVRAYQKAFRSWRLDATWRERARQFALDYDADHVAATYWAPLLKGLETAG